METETLDLKKKKKVNDHRVPFYTINISLKLLTTQPNAVKHDSTYY